MTEHDSEEHLLVYDGKTNELFKIYLLNILLSILTLGIYYFWGKTRKRRYLTSSFKLDQDRFEYTGYALELFVGLVLGLIFLALLSLPLAWSVYTIAKFESVDKPSPTNQTASSEEQPRYHIEQYDHFKKNKIIIDYKNIYDFWVVYRTNGFLFNYENDRMEIQFYTKNNFTFLDYPIIFNPKENPLLLFALLLVPFYLIFYFVFLPFVIVYGSLRYRVSRLRWRGIRSHLNGSAILYGLMGLFNTFMKVITLGFWIPLSDAWMIKYKVKKFYFGNQKASFNPSIKLLLSTNLATIGASLYLIGLMAACGYWLLPWIASYSSDQSWIVEDFIRKILEEGYWIALIVLAWGCYAPRYWYRATLLRERYNKLRFGKVRFSCNASGLQYFKLFVINDLIFICTLGFGLPFIWQRRMKFFTRHVKIYGNINELDIEQAPGKKPRFGGGFASVMNLEIGLI